MDETYEREFTKRLDMILEKHNFNILKYAFLNTKFTAGNISKMIWNIRTTVEKNGKIEILDLFVKSNRSETDDILTDAHLNEINVYSKIVPCFNEFAVEHRTDRFENIPHCYGVSSADQHHIVVLDNLKSGGFRKRDFAPYDLNHIKIVLKVFAEWHAFSFALRDQKPEVFNELQKPKLGLVKCQTLDVIVTLHEQQIDFAIGLYEEKNKPIVLQKLKLLRNNHRIMFEKLLNNCDEEYLAFTQGDAFNANFMFKYDEKSIPTDVRIIDWQIAVLGSPLLDIAQIFFFCCRREELEGMDDLLHFYYSILSEKIRKLGSNPAECFPWEICVGSFRKYASLAIAAVPFIMGMLFSDTFMEELNGAGEVPEKGDVYSIFEDEISDPEAFFERMNSILEICAERDLF